MLIIECNNCKCKRILTDKNDDIFCVECGTYLKFNSVIRMILDDEYIKYDKSTHVDKRYDLYYFLFHDITAKNRFLSTCDKNNQLCKLLTKNNIIIEDIEITVEKIHDYSKNIQDNDKKCKNPDCKHIMPFLFVRKRFPNGRKIYCSMECYYNHRSVLQMGDNNTSHRMTEETKRMAAKKVSQSLRNKIEYDGYMPNVTNSWCKILYDVVINERNIKMRSSWEVLFYLLNPKLKYETLRIPYIHNGKSHIYIVDFLDDVNQIVYEVKPKSEQKKAKNISKYNHIMKWCDDNKYQFTYIDEKWIIEHFQDNILILEKQPMSEKLIKNLMRVK